MQACTMYVVSISFDQSVHFVKSNCYKSIEGSVIEGDEDK